MTNNRSPSRPFFSRLADLWTGRLPLSEAFWTYAIFWGLLINLAATLCSLTLLVAVGGDAASKEWAPLAALALHLLPVPYNLMVLVGVWRSAGRPEVKPAAALLARSAVVVWCAAMILS